MDNATVDHPPPYDQLKNTSDCQLWNVKTSKAIITKIAENKKQNKHNKVQKFAMIKIYFVN